MLRGRVAITSLLAALPAAAVLGYAADRLRMAELEVALERVVRSQVNEQVRERCESDPTWFLAGPLLGRPRGGVFQSTDPNALPPRPRVSRQPFELFAYDEEFLGTSPAAARFPPEFRAPLRREDQPVRGRFASEGGTGVQVAMRTGWIAGPCAYFLGRMEPPPNYLRTQILIYASLFAAAFLVALAASTETISRVRKLARVAHESADAGYSTIAPDSKKDELSSLTFAFNDAANELHQRRARIDDQDAALRRFVKSTEEEVSRPLAALEATLGAIVTGPSQARDDVHQALRQAHDLSGEVENLIAAARLRLIGPEPPTSQLDLNAVVTRVIARHLPVAEASGVKLHLSLPPRIVIVDGDEPLLERAIANVVDNAVRYNHRGGDVHVVLALAEDGARYRLLVTDTGPGVNDEAFRGLTAVRRFRGDEGRSRRPGAPGLGLAVAREVCDRLHVQLDLKRPGQGGFEVEFSGLTAPGAQHARPV
jgi:signal transduction histidine kinase